MEPDGATIDHHLGTRLLAGQEPAARLPSYSGPVAASGV